MRIHRSSDKIQSRSGPTVGHSANAAVARQNLYPVAERCFLPRRVKMVLPLCFAFRILPFSDTKSANDTNFDGSAVFIDNCEHCTSSTR